MWCGPWRGVFKLFHLDFDAERHAEEIADAAELLCQHEARAEACTREADEKRQLKAAHSKQSMVLERKIGKQREAATGRAPGAVKTKAGLHASRGARHVMWCRSTQSTTRVCLRRDG